MKLNLISHLRLSLSRVAILTALGLGVSSSAFGIVLSFSGGGGTPLSMTLTSPVSYTITQSAGLGDAPFFVFQGVGNPFGAVITFVSGNITFSVNGGPSRSVFQTASGVPVNDLAANDLYFFGQLPGVSVGNTVILSAGTLTTTSNFAGAAPASGNFQTFIIEGYGAKISTFGTTAGGNVPDSGATVALLGVGLLGLFSFARISRRMA
jgi:hypothetical protein